MLYKKSETYLALLSGRASASGHLEKINQGNDEMITTLSLVMGQQGQLQPDKI